MATKPPSPPVPPITNPSLPPTRDADIGKRDHGGGRNVEPIYRAPVAPPAPPKK